MLLFFNKQTHPIFLLILLATCFGQQAYSKTLYERFKGFLSKESAKSQEKSFREKMKGEITELRKKDSNQESTLWYHNKTKPGVLKYAIKQSRMISAIPFHLSFLVSKNYYKEFKEQNHTLPPASKKQLSQMTQGNDTVINEFSNLFSLFIYKDLFEDAQVSSGVSEASQSRYSLNLSPLYNKCQTLECLKELKKTSTHYFEKLFIDHHLYLHDILKNKVSTNNRSLASSSLFNVVKNLNIASYLKSVVFDYIYALSPHPIFYKVYKNFMRSFKSNSDDQENEATTKFFGMILKEMNKIAMDKTKKVKGELIAKAYSNAIKDVEANEILLFSILGDQINSIKRNINSIAKNELYPLDELKSQLKHLKKSYLPFYEITKNDKLEKTLSYEEVLFLKILLNQDIKPKKLEELAKTKKEPIEINKNYLSLNQPSWYDYNRILFNITLDDKYKTLPFLSGLFLKDSFWSRSYLNEEAMKTLHYSFIKLISFNEAAQMTLDSKSYTDWGRKYLYSFSLANMMYRIDETNKNHWENFFNPFIITSMQ